ncbi:MAG: DUF7352 domain-containing protein [Alcanivorax sediminis]|uniref:DUF7352 domain-containing protein n=1 Tax=Alcanivorax sediminis TaxID=2663008 RepID=A0A6N7LTI1_9GAMM|nr:hypothetical protein [Alcanivorax sediminis]MQX53582.1 hypothetical protein [Alcanivorax sediminis]
MKTIHKHRLNTSSDVQEIRLQESGKVLRVDYILQDAAIYMWVEVDADTVIDTPKEVRTFKVFTTGSGIPDNASYLGTTLDHMQAQAYHVYELKN